MTPLGMTAPPIRSEAVRERLTPKSNTKLSHTLLWKAGPSASAQAFKAGARVGLDGIYRWLCVEQAGKRDTAPAPKEYCSFWQGCADSARFLGGMLGKKQSVRQKKQETQQRERLLVIKLARGEWKQDGNDRFLSWRTNTGISPFHVEVRAWPCVARYWHRVSYPPDSPPHMSVLCTTDLCCSPTHWLFSTQLADNVIPWGPLTFTLFLSPAPAFQSDGTESRREERANTMNQSFLQKFYSARQLRRVGREFPLLHGAIFSSSVSEGLSQVAILSSHNLQFYLHLCLIVQYCKHNLAHLTCIHDFI